MLQERFNPQFPYFYLGSFGLLCTCAPCAPAIKIPPVDLATIFRTCHPHSVPCFNTYSICTARNVSFCWLPNDSASGRPGRDARSVSYRRTSGSQSRRTDPFNDCLWDIRVTGIRGLGTTHTTHGLALLRQRNYSRLIQLPHAADAAVPNTFDTATAMVASREPGELSRTRELSSGSATSENLLPSGGAGSLE